MGLTGSNIQQICGFSYCVSIFPCSLTGTQPRTKPVLTSGRKSQGQSVTSWSSKSFVKTHKNYQTHFTRPGSTYGMGLPNNGRYKIIRSN